ncbi:MAG TPA: GGDEF domain-containing protein [Mycobacteriales bacterium]|nr:GGDEF domain-containing protein [Mycobacteriales bacterium]
MSEIQSDESRQDPSARAPKSVSQVTVVAMRLPAQRDRVVSTRNRRHADVPRLHAVDHLNGAGRDELTGALKRESGHLRLQREIDRAHAHRGVMAIAFLDVVGLKVINDREGHAAGDAALVAVGTALVDKLRSCDLVVRWGGDDFVCALPTISVAGARRRMEEVRNRFQQLHPAADVRIGVAALRRDETLQSVVGRAERDLDASFPSSDAPGG